MDIKKLQIHVLALFFVLFLSMEQPVFALGKQENIVIPANYPQKYDSAYIHRIKPLYKDVSDEHIFHVALDMLKDTNGEFSRRAILGNNLSQKPIKVMFKDLGTINAGYSDFDALGWKKNGRLYIFINPKHKDAPPGALAALLSHEALHQDE